MRVLQVHNFYQQPGGEDVVVAGERNILRAGGWEVDLWSLSNDSISGGIAKVRAAWQSNYSPASRDAMRDKLSSFEPDIVHVHNFFPLFSPSIYDACVAANVPVVQTLHNFRTICPGGFLFRNGAVCVECVGGSPYHSVGHRCYRGSLAGTLSVARMANHYQKSGLWHDRVDRFVALSEFAKTWFVAGGYPAERISVKHNFTPDPGPQKGPEAPRDGALFVGRLSPEKGIGTLLKAWAQLDAPLRIAGDGPLRDQVEQAVGGSVCFLGHLTRPELIAELRRAKFLVVPSEWYEGPLTIMEAFACGTPVICSDLGAMQEMVEDGETGLRFPAGDQEALASTVRRALETPDQLERMGRKARQTYERKYTPGENFRMLTALYHDVLGQSGDEEG